MHTVVRRGGAGVFIVKKIGAPHQLSGAWAHKVMGALNAIPDGLMCKAWAADALAAATSSKYTYEMDLGCVRSRLEGLQGWVGHLVRTRLNGAGDEFHTHPRSVVSIGSVRHDRSG